MKAYFDTAILAKSYFPESNSPEAEALIGQFSLPIIFTHLQELEIRTAARLKLFRKEISIEILQAGFQAMKDDWDHGVLQRPAYNFSVVYRDAEILSEKHVIATGCRTLDILHVALAMQFKATDFVSFDQRQRKLAKEAGLRVKP